MDTTTQSHEDLVISGDAVYENETIAVDLTGTAGSVTSATNETADQTDKTLLVTIDGGDEQTITLSGDTDTAVAVAAEINAVLLGARATVDTGHIVITSDSTGINSSVAIGEGTCTITWGTAVAGAGDPTTWPKGTVLARNTSTGYLGKYNASGSNGLNAMRFVLPYEVTFAASGNHRHRVLKKGVVLASQLSVIGSSAALTAVQKDQLLANSGIVPVDAR
jgi:hypothetical protein